MAVAVLLVLGVAAAWSVLIPGVSAWENIIVAVIGSLRLTGPVAAAFAAWVAVRRRRGTGGRSLTTWQAVRAPLAVLVVAGGAFTATVLVLAIRTMITEQAGRLLPSGLVMGVAGLALYVVIGWVTGWLLPWTITPALAGLGCYGLFAGLAQGPPWADRLTPATREPYDLFRGLSAAAFTDQTLWLLGISAALLLGWAAVVTRQVLVLAAALLAVLAAGTGVARLFTEPGPGSAQQVVYSCQEWPIMVCVHPGMHAGLPELGSAFIKIASRLAGTPGEFSRLEQHPRRDRGASCSGDGSDPRGRPGRRIRRKGGRRVRRGSRHEVRGHLGEWIPRHRDRVAARQAAPRRAAPRAPVRRRVVLRSHGGPAARLAPAVLRRLHGVPATKHSLRRGPREPPPSRPHRPPPRCVRRARPRSTRSIPTPATSPRPIGDRICHLKAGTDDRPSGSQTP